MRLRSLKIDCSSHSLCVSVAVSTNCLVQSPLHLYPPISTKENPESPSHFSHLYNPIQNRNTSLLPQLQKTCKQIRYRPNNLQPDSQNTSTQHPFASGIMDSDDPASFLYDDSFTQAEIEAMNREEGAKMNRSKEQKAKEKEKEKMRRDSAFQEKKNQKSRAKKKKDSTLANFNNGGDAGSSSIMDFANDRNR